jgi:hypothetical protein
MLKGKNDRPKKKFFYFFYIFLSQLRVGLMERLEPYGSIDEAVAHLFNLFSGNGFVSRSEVVKSAEKVWPGSGAVVGAFFDTYYDSARYGTMQLHDFAKGLAAAVLVEKNEDDASLTSDGTFFNRLMWTWDRSVELPVIQQGANFSEEACRGKAALLLSLQWMAEAGGAAVVQAFENQVGGHKGEAEMKAAGDTIMKPLNLQVNYLNCVQVSNK